MPFSMGIKKATKTLPSKTKLTVNRSVSNLHLWLTGLGSKKYSAKNSEPCTPLFLELSKSQSKLVLSFSFVIIYYFLTSQISIANAPLIITTKSAKAKAKTNSLTLTTIMTLAAASTQLHANPNPPFLLFSKRHIQVREFRVFRRRRLKQTTGSSLLRCSQFEFEDLFQSLVSRFPSVNSLEFIAPALGFAGGFALHRHSKDRLRHRGDSDVGEWILFTSPTPFSRFVFLRCPSVSFAGGEDVNKGRMVVRSDGDGVGWDG